MFWLWGSPAGNASGLQGNVDTGNERAARWRDSFAPQITGVMTWVPIDSRKAHMAAFVEIAASDNGTGGRRDPNSTRLEGASGNSATKNKFLKVFQGDVIVATFTGGFRDTWRRSKENP